jgi:tryptophanyl-tRNA synthetase
MTQFKEKGEQQGFVSVGLFAYPVLQAADILAHRATGVPVGADQLQHLELARDIARRFNQRFGETFPDPQAIVTRATRVMSPADPTRKMSKSLGDKHCIGVFEGEEAIRKKIRSHVTDVGAAREGEGEIPPGVDNLLTLLQAAAPQAEVDAFRAAEREGKLRYSDLKQAVADRVIELLRPIRERREALRLEDVHAVLREGAARAESSARAVLAEARERIGLFRG